MSNCKDPENRSKKVRTCGGHSHKKKKKPSHEIIECNAYTMDQVEDWELLYGLTDREIENQDLLW